MESNLSLTIAVDGGDKNTGQHQQQRNSRALVILRWQRVLHHPSFRRMVGAAVDVVFHSVLHWFIHVCCCRYYVSRSNFVMYN